MLYRRVSKGISDYKLVADDSAYPDKITSMISKYPDSDFYETIYKYTEDHKKQFDISGSVSGFTGLVTDRFVFDFDDKKNPEAARADASLLVDRLVEYGVPAEAVSCYFSGNKGFHVQVVTSLSLTKKEVDPIIIALTSELKTADTKILDENRLFRIPGTINKASGMRKIPLTHYELKTESIDSIKERAKPTSGSWTFLPNKVISELPEELVKLQKTTKTKLEIVKDHENTEPIVGQPDLASMPTFLTKPLGALLQGFFEDGERNDALMLLATNLRKASIPKDVAYSMLKSTLRQRKNRTGIDYDKSELYHTVINLVYSPRWRGGTYTYDHPLIQKTIDRFGFGEDDKTLETDKGIYSIGEVSSYFKDFAQNIDSNTVKLGLPSIDEKIRVTTSTLTCLLAAPGSGKTTLTFNILNSFSNQGEKAMFFSLDMGAPQVIQRIIQRLTGYNNDKIFEIYKQDKKDEIAAIEKKYTEAYKNVSFCFKSGLTVDMIREKILQEKERLGEFPKLVAIDYLEGIHGPLTDPNANKSLIVTQLKDLANEFQIAVFLLVQPQKSAGDPSYELNSYRKIKGSSVIEEAASVIFTMYRPGYNPKDNSDDVYATITVVKNRMGELGAFDFRWDGPTGTIDELTEDQRTALESLRKQIERERADDQRSDLW